MPWLYVKDGSICSIKNKPTSEQTNKTTQGNPADSYFYLMGV